MIHLYLQVDQICSLASKEQRVEREHQNTELAFLCYCSTCNFFLVLIFIVLVLMIIVPSACTLYRRRLLPQPVSQTQDISEGETMETIM